MPSRNKIYRIGEAAAALGVRTSVLRFWETEFPELAPRRGESGQRSYSEQDMELLRRIRELLYTRGLTIEGARQALNKRPAATALTEEQKQARSQELEERRRGIASRRREKAVLRREQEAAFLQDMLRELREVRELLETPDKGTMP
ncbi:MAG: MerR family transcriptional regulator [Desulfovibrionaceae bacterium]|nr:MerR family transcriptional regulator [Desulfovibrionaceae bacterium]